MSAFARAVRGTASRVSPRDVGAREAWIFPESIGDLSGVPTVPHL